MHLSAELFFNLRAFPHHGVFGINEPVWRGVANLPYYLGAMLDQVGGSYRVMLGRAADFPLVTILQPERVMIAPGAVIKPYTVIEGPALIDEGAAVGPCAYLRGGVIVGRGARVGHGTEVKRSILFPGASALHGNRILDSLIGWHVNLAAHLVTFNLRSDGRTVPIHLPDGKHLDTGLPKLGIIAGDGCWFGGDVRFRPGNHFLPNTRL